MTQHIYKAKSGNTPKKQPITVQLLNKIIMRVRKSNCSYKLNNEQITSFTMQTTQFCSPKIKTFND